MEAVFLAAGRGSRMGANGDDHKALRELMGVPIIERGIRAFRAAGIQRFTIVVGHAAELIESAIGDGSRLGVEVRYAYNDDWQLGNGTSLYAVREMVNGERFVLAMADHWFEPAMAQLLIDRAAVDERSLLCVDTDGSRVWDLDDATKVRIGPDGAVTAAAKDLAQFDAIDCGLFVCSPAVFPALERAFAEGDYELSAAMRALEGPARLAAVSIDGRLWEDVDTEIAFGGALRKLRDSLHSRDEGLVSRFLNRPLSLRLTSLAIKLRLTPNMLSVISFVMAISAGIAFGFGLLIPAAIGVQLASIVDGSDGEVARARFMTSRWGGMMDSLLDRVADAVILGGIGIFLLQGEARWWEIAPLIAAIAGAPMSMMAKDRYAIATGRQWVAGSSDGVGRYLLAGRDGRLFIIFLGGLTGLLVPALWYIAVVSALLLVWRMAQMWREMRPARVPPAPAQT
jgi:1L-myo-inositol 1-phosphate cytidylyltransferase / CDP-L-myo-inositol myo-inositolphosphotransferase